MYVFLGVMALIFIAWSAFIAWTAVHDLRQLEKELNA